jgi:hypothetical protein
MGGAVGEEAPGPASAPGDGRAAPFEEAQAASAAVGAIARRRRKSRRAFVESARWSFDMTGS